jgi:hypothetical protein
LNTVRFPWRASERRSQSFPCLDNDLLLSLAKRRVNHLRALNIAEESRMVASPLGSEEQNDQV